MAGKKICMRLIAGAALLCMAAFAGCAEERGSAAANRTQLSEMEAYPRELGTFEGLDAETEWQIINDYYRYFIARATSSWHIGTVNDYYVSRYYGTYNGNTVIMMMPDFSVDMAIVHDYTIADIRFAYQAGMEILVWNQESGFYNFSMAYEMRLLTQDDVRAIHQKMYGAITGGIND